VPRLQRRARGGVALLHHVRAGGRVSPSPAERYQRGARVGRNRGIAPSLVFASGPRIPR
jgi:hypothetical protein